MSSSSHTLPENVRSRLATLHRVQQETIARLPETNALNGAVTATLEWLGLDVDNPNHSIDLQNGVITEAPPKDASAPVTVADTSEQPPDPTPIR